MILFLLLVHTVFFPAAVSAQVLNFNAEWDYRESGGEGRDTLRTFQERYNLGAGLSQGKTFQPTSALTASFGVGYTRTEANSQGELVDYEHITPRSRFTVANDIFVGQLSGYIGRNRISTSTGALVSTDKSWDATLTSAWDLPLFPIIRLDTSEITNSNADIFKAIGQSAAASTRNTTLSVDWDLLLARINYIYTDITSGDPAEGENVLKSHFINLDTSGGISRFIHYRLSQQYRRSTQDFNRTAAGPEGNLFLLRGEAWSKVIDPFAGTDPFTLPEPVDVTLTSNPGLKDQILDVAALTVPSGNRVCLSYTFNEFQKVDTLRIHVLTPLTASQADGMQWYLYVRDPVGTQWIAASTTPLPSNFDSVARRFTLSLSREADEIMVVAINNTGVELDISEFEAYTTHEAEAFGSTATNYYTNANVGVRLSKAVSLAVGLVRDHTENESLNGSAVLDQQTLNSGLSWIASPTVTTSLSFSEHRFVQEGQSDKKARDYNLGVNTHPLRTLNVSLGAGRSDGYEGDWKTSTTYHYSLATMASLYPDLSTGMNFSVRDGESYSESGDVIGTSTQFFGIMNVIARLRRNLTANLSANYSKNSRNGIRSPENASGYVSLQYTPSAYLNMRGTYTANILGTSGSDQLSLAMNVALLRTDKVNLRLFANHTESGSTRSDLFSVNGTWSINRYLLLRYRENFTFADTFSYAMHVTLDLSF